MKKRTWKKFLCTALAAAILATAAAGCGKSAGSSSAAGSASASGAASAGQKATSLTIGISADPSTLEPMIQSGQSVRLIKMCMYRGLLAYESDGKIGDEIAESYDVAKDNVTYTFHLRKNAKFHNGSDITAEDVKFSIERIMDPKVGATFRQDFENMVDHVKVVDTKTVQIVLKQPCASFLDYLTLPESVIVSKSWCNAHNNDLNSNPMGSGPYQFVSWDKGRQITLKAFKSFYKTGKPETENLTFSTITDNTTRTNALTTGDADLIDYVSAKDAITLEKNKDYTVDVSEGPFMCLQINCTKGPLANAKVRQAIAYAVNRKGVIDTAFMGRGTALFGFPTLKGQNGYDGKYDNYFSYDPAKAKELLKEAGYANGFSVKILATSTYEFHKQTALVVQDSLKAVGINAQVELPDWSTRIDRSNKGDYDILVSGTAGNIVDMDWCTNYFQSGETRMNSAPGFADKKVDSLLKEGRETLDTTKRAEIYDQLRKEILDQSPFVFINYREQIFARSAKVKGFVNLPGILTYNSGITIEDTYKTE